MAENKTFNGINVTLVEDKEEMTKVAAEIILERMKSANPLKLLVPTGTTPEGVYELLSRQGAEVLSNAIFFNMDEYGHLENGVFRFVSEDHPASYRKYMNERLFSKIAPRPRHYFPGIENAKTPGHYDELIENLGGIDLCLNAMGEDGHIFGFNSPPESGFGSVTRMVKLTEDTQSVNQGLTGLETPSHAVTVGLKTGMASKEILFLVCGERKADILRKVLYSPEPTEEIPATILAKHPNCHWIVDKAAASKLN
ncbi:MAG: glucosamine-6-phosphate deaminase [Candidatus Aenigmarchaeota archaeon]|nr:glucosamine-6-phosphate deaminase [Candidatus Aenigmarchaeota archaeon]